MYETENGVVFEGSRVLQERGKAVLCDIPDLDGRVWVPKSQITDESEVWEPDQEAGDLVVRKWFARQKGWS